MALASQTVVSNGSLTLLTLSIDYLARTDITVRYNGVINVANWSWVGPTSNQIAFSPAVPNGTVVKVSRISLATAIKNIYATGATFNSPTMDENFKQLLLLAQEAKENSTAYGIAVDNGFVGTESQWLASLVGATGPAGPANSLAIGTVTAGAAAASITGTAPSQTLNLVLQTGAQGIQGVQGPAGPPNSLAIGTVTAGPAAASITGTAPAQTLNLVLQTGAQGIQGPQGDQGIQGIPGSGTNVTVKDEGSTLTTACTEMNFVGAGVTASNVGTVVTVTIPTPSFDITTEQMFWLGQ